MTSDLEEKHWGGERGGEIEKREGTVSVKQRREASGEAEATNQLLDLDDSLQDGER